ncbi:sigma-54 dependent transcriptional regulator [Granulicella sp. dw_53]|uniref:sigma-54-dependent Fis family transcriptional regulator n=1 Tax=Granulicella sp. dw_53 TaxID=2719792 RepID=UPI00210630B6|nr:sigma-54 dependent transcriptional regulator [Granulicella sp. dw_53]
MPGINGIPTGKTEDREMAAVQGLMGSAGLKGVASSAAESAPVATGDTAGERDRPVLQVLVVDDDVDLLQACSEVAVGMGCAVMHAESVEAAQTILKFQKIDLLLLDLRLPGGGGLALLEQVKTLYPETGVVVMTAFATVSSAVEAMRIGAGDYLTKPFAVEDLKTVIERAGQRMHFHQESRRLREKLRTRQGMGDLVGQSPEMEKLYRILSKVAFSTHPVLILGESGTGKEMVARSIHTNGPNADKPFLMVDCGALDPTLIESELFGHVEGAFPGADRAKDGILASAHGGTVFLDEIGDLPLPLQGKLLRALQEKEVCPIGSTDAVPISGRVLAASNRDLTAMVAQGRFRKDLYFRLNVVNLRIPPLRDRREDIHALALHFLERMERESGVARSFSEDALRVMLEYSWPGNVRELENTIERACAFSSGPLLHMGDLPTQLQDFRIHRAAEAKRAAEMDGMMDGTMAAIARRAGIVSIATMERHAILGTIRQLKGDKLMAAKLLGIGKTTLYRKLKEYGISDVRDAM